MFTFKPSQVTLSMSYHITMQSSNVKTGPMPVTTSSRDSCSPVCPFFGNGCYAESGPLRIHWNAVTANQRGEGFYDHCATIASIEEGSIYRYNQAGDLPHVGGIIDSEALKMLCEASQHLKGFTYTHHDVTIPENLESLYLSNSAGFTVNLSANDLDHADELYSTGLPVCVVLPITQEENLTTPAGNKVVVCPAAIRDNVSCFTCQLCRRADRTVIVGFPAHGTGAKRADSVARKIINIKSI
jgi:hypothetical protein